jgi:hypothetical protein
MIGTGTREVWESLLTEDPGALVTQTPNWVDCLCATGAYTDATVAWEAPDGHRFVLPLVRRRGLPQVLALAGSMPGGWGMGGLLGSRPANADDVTVAFAALKRAKFLRVDVRPNPLTAAAWSAGSPPGVVAVPRLAHVLDLDGGFDRVWTQSFKSDTRNRIRKAEHAGLVVECDTTGRLIPIFYGLFRKSIDRWAEHQHEPRMLARWRNQRRDPVAKLQLIARTLGDGCRTWVAWHGDDPAAAILVLQGGNVSYTRGAMDERLAGQTRANYLLHKLAIEDACRSGCRAYHMGESGPSTSLALFKTRFGARAHPYAEYYLERLPLTAADRAARRLVKRLIRFQDA